uniref:Uncharacterized protein n=1 Tax=Arundo donax TaxID=35708 RepID=A0A0A9BL38_ARUDO
MTMENIFKQKGSLACMFS